MDSGREPARQVENRTYNLRLVSAEREGSGVRLVLQNVGGKKVVAYKVTVGNLQMEEDFIYSDGGIAPGDILAVDFPTAHPGSPVRILAALFDDKTWEGEPSAAAVIKARRRGEKKQLERALALVSAALKSPDGMTPEALERLKSKIQALPETDPDDNSAAVRGGLRDKKASIANDVESLKQDGRDAERLTSGLERLRSHYRELIARM